MQLLAGELPAKSREERRLFLSPPRGHTSPSLKITHCPHIALPEASLSSRHAFAQRPSAPVGTRGRGPAPAARTQCLPWPQAAFSTSGPLPPTNHPFPSSLQLSPGVLNTAPAAWLFLGRSPYLESPTLLPPLS